MEHGTIRGAAGDRQIVKGTDARPRSQDFVLWTLEHDAGIKGVREAQECNRGCTEGGSATGPALEKKMKTAEFW